jgi:integrase
MARPATGTIIEHKAKDGRVTRTLRFYVNGQRQRIPLGAVSRDEAEERLRHTLADVQRGVWEPPKQPSPSPAESPVFHDYADDWWQIREPDLAENTRLDYRWRLEAHLIPFFGELRLDEITPATVKRYIAGKLAGTVYDKGREIGTADDPLSPRSINMTVILLGAILESAVEDELMVRNPARGRNRRAKERKPQRSYLDTAGQIEALLTAARELDAEAPKGRKHVKRKAMIATLMFTGLRISELCALRWRDVDLAAGWLTVRGTKTDQAARRVKIRGALRDELLSLRADTNTADANAYVFATRTGARLSDDNFRSRPFAAAIARANKNLEKAGEPPLPEKLTPHSLRRTFASILYALGEDPGVVMDEMGHSDPELALRVYRQAMRRDDGEREKLRTLVDGGIGPIKADEAETADEAAEAEAADQARNGSAQR